jgi:hypothetical protein
MSEVGARIHEALRMPTSPPYHRGQQHAQRGVCVDDEYDGRHEEPLQFFGDGLSDDLDIHWNVAARGTRIGAGFVRGGDELLRDLPIDSRQPDSESGGEAIHAIRRAQVHFGIDCDRSG